MLLLKRKDKNEKGFTIVELLVVLMLVVILFVSFGTFFTNYLSLYFGYQKDANNFSELAHQTQRISDVLRSIIDISSPQPDDLVAYAYFSPSDTYVSQVHYYLNASKTAVMVDITHMTANPPNGTLITSSKKTFTIVSNYKQITGGSLFTYYDASGTVLATPISNQHIIMDIGVNLVETASHSSSGQQYSVTVSLRNRKTNL